MKKRVNISIDEELHDWVVKHHGDGYFSKWISDQLTAFSSSLEVSRIEQDNETILSGAKNMKDLCDELEFRRSLYSKELAEKKSEKKVGFDKDEWFKNMDAMAFQLARQYDNSEDGYPVNFDDETIKKIKKISFYLEDQDQNLSRKKIRSELRAMLNPMIENMINSLVDVLMEKTSKDVTRGVMLEKLATSTKEKRAQKELK